MKLFAGPWVGEFGWELMMWQALVRSQAHKYDEVVVSSRPGNEYLYSDFRTEYIPHDIVGNTDCDFCNGRSYANKAEPWRKKGYQVLTPYRFPWYKGDLSTYNSQKFIKFGKVDEEVSYDIVIHARDTGKCGTSFRNWSRAKWTKLLSKFPDAKVCAIGSKDAAWCPDNIQDYRGVSLETASNILASSKCIVGPSSGPMHLASLCGCTHVVLTDKCNRARYTKLWNPHNTKSIVIDQQGWDPSVELVYTNICEVLNG